MITKRLEVLWLLSLIVLFVSLIPDIHNYIGKHGNVLDKFGMFSKVAIFIGMFFGYFIIRRQNSKK